MLVLGIMSGTSIDSVDYALCEVGEERVRLREYWQVDFPAGLRARLHAGAAGTARSHEVGQLHHDLGRFYAKHARKKAELVGLHGQTIYHASDATLQIGEPVWLAQKLGVPVINNFRAADLAAGGQGAPLATMFHRVVFAERGKHVCVNNLGGISNVTSIDCTRGSKPRVLAFDTGPANILINLAMRHFTKGKLEMDRGGAWAAKGNVDESLLKRWMRHPYFRKKPPKSTGRELFGEAFLKPYLVGRNVRPGRSGRLLTRAAPYGSGRGAEGGSAGTPSPTLRTPQDLIATLTEFTARSIAMNYELHLPSGPDRVILAGGGAANPALVRALRQNLPRTEIIPVEQLGWPLQAIEPAAFALLAWLRFHNCPGNIPETTGASRPVLLGQITSP